MPFTSFGIVTPGLAIYTATSQNGSFGATVSYSLTVGTLQCWTFGPAYCMYFETLSRNIPQLLRRCRMQTQNINGQGSGFGNR